jgi:hypothetical protein
LATVDSVEPSAANLAMKSSRGAIGQPWSFGTAFGTAVTAQRFGTMGDMLRLVPERWQDRVIVNSHECWIWTGYVTPGGYGYAGVEGRHEYVHRELYRRANGTIPAGLTIDHLCRVKSCCNPEHLEAVTMRENAARAPDSLVAKNLAKTECPHGHGPYSFYGKRRRCRICEYRTIYRNRKGPSPLG